MCRKGRIVHVVATSCTLAILIAIATILVHFYVIQVGGTHTDEHGSPHRQVTAPAPLEDIQNSIQEEMRGFVEASAEAKHEVRSVSSSSYVQSRPVYQKPKPKLVLPKQLQQQKPIQSVTQAQKAVPGANPHLVTQTVFGFLDFVTTVGNTVMVFTPQTKKVDLIAPSSSSQIRESISVQPTEEAKKEAKIAETETETLEAPKDSNQRTARLLEIDDEDDGDISIPQEQLESSEYEPQIFATTATATPTPSVVTASSNPEYINLMVDSSSVVTSQEAKIPKSSHVAIVTSEPEVRTKVNVVTAVKATENKVTSTSSSKGFTLKFQNPPIKASSSSESKSKETKEEYPTGLVSRNVESKVNNGVTTIHETKILGTFIGTQYARILESSSTILPSVVTASRSASSTTTATKIAEPEIFTARSVSSSGDTENDERFSAELLENEEPVETLVEESTLTPEPTPTLSSASFEESTQYVLPQKAQVYTSPIPSPNAYSRQPQIYVDVSPASAFDYIVTATPSRKPFRPQASRTTETSNRFTNRFNKNPPPTSTESNELVLQYESTAEENSRRLPNRFRSNRNNNPRGGGYKPSKQIIEAEILPTSSSQYISAVATTAAPTPRKFTRGRGTGTPPAKNGQEFKLGGRNSFSGSPSPRGQQQYITPTSSTSVYRFKLNRPTGRWRFKPSPKPKVNIIRTKEEEEAAKQNKELLQAANSNNGAIYPQGYNDQGEVQDIQTGEESRTESNELVQDFDTTSELLPETLRVATVTPTDFSDFDNSRMIEIATIRSPYVFQAGNVKNTRYITLTKTFTKDMIQPTQVMGSFANPTLENILATRAPYERILEGSNNIATLPLVILGSDTATPPLETITQTFSTTQVMLKTSILPVLYEGVTTLYTLTQSYFVTRLVAAYKTVPPAELFHFVPTKSLTEFNTALQEAGTEHREQLLGSETNENDGNYENIVAPPDELTSLGSDFDPSSMDDKFSRTLQKSQKLLAAAPSPKSKSQEQGSLPDFSSLSPEQLAFLRYFATAGQQGQGLIPMQNPLQNFFASPLLPSLQGQYQMPAVAASSPIVLNTVTTVVETKTLRIQFGSKPTHTIIYSTKIFPTKVTSYIAASVAATPAIPNYFQPHPFPLAYVG